MEPHGSHLTPTQEPPAHQLLLPGNGLQHPFIAAGDPFGFLGPNGTALSFQAENEMDKPEAQAAFARFLAMRGKGNGLPPPQQRPGLQRTARLSSASTIPPPATAITTSAPSLAAPMSERAHAGKKHEAEEPLPLSAPPMLRRKRLEAFLRAHSRASVGAEGPNSVTQHPAMIPPPQVVPLNSTSSAPGGGASSSTGVDDAPPECPPTPLIEDEEDETGNPSTGVLPALPTVALSAEEVERQLLEMPNVAPFVVRSFSLCRNPPEGSLSIRASQVQPGYVIVRFFPFITENVILLFSTNIYQNVLSAYRDYLLRYFMRSDLQGVRDIRRAILLHYTTAQLDVLYEALKLLLRAEEGRLQLEPRLYPQVWDLTRAIPIIKQLRESPLMPFVVTDPSLLENPRSLEGPKWIEARFALLEARMPIGCLSIWVYPSARVQFHLGPKKIVTLNVSRNIHSDIIELYSEYLIEYLGVIEPQEDQGILDALPQYSIPQLNLLAEALTFLLRLSDPVIGHRVRNEAFAMDQSVSLSALQQQLRVLSNLEVGQIVRNAAQRLLEVVQKQIVEKS